MTRWGRMQGWPKRLTPENLAQVFHVEYERAAPGFGYATRKRSRVPWKEVPEANRKLMIHTAKQVLEWIAWVTKSQKVRPCWSNGKKKGSAV